jgi:hypothetical protein
LFSSCHPDDFSKGYQVPGRGQGLASSGATAFEWGGNTVSAEAVIAECAAVIALLALIVSIEQMRASRMHSRKSVRPVLQFRSGYVKPGLVGLSLQNVGLGPAVIVRSRVWLDGSDVGSFSPRP